MTSWWQKSGEKDSKIEFLQKCINQLISENEKFKKDYDRILSLNDEMALTYDHKSRENTTIKNSAAYIRAANTKLIDENSELVDKVNELKQELYQLKRKYEVLDPVAKVKND